MNRARTLGAILLPLMGLLITACGPNGLLKSLGGSSTVHTAEAACWFVQNAYGERVSWANRTPVKLIVNDSFPSQYYPALEGAVKDWETAMGTSLFEIQYGSNGSPNVPAQDGISEIYWLTTWEADRTSEQARTSVYWVGKQIQEADMRINAKDFTYYLDTPSSPKDVHLQSLLVHELGHVLGLKHNDTGGSVMATYLPSDTDRSTIPTGDIDSMKCEY